jgi:hypothetical protein
MANLIGPDNQLLSNVVEKLATSSEFTEDGLWVASNNFGKHVSADRRSLPTGETRMANRGVAAAKGVIGQNEDNIAFFESPSVVDDFVLRRTPSGQKQQARSMYDIAHGIGLGITQRQYSVYGDNAIDWNQPKGFAARRAVIGPYCFDSMATAGGTKRTSLYMVGWDVYQGVHHIFPDGEDMGINMQDMDINVVIDPVFTDRVRWIPYWITWFYLDFGLVVLEDRALIRIANINPDSVTASDYKIVYMLLSESFRLMRVPKSQIRIYGNVDGLSFLDNMSVMIDQMQIKPVEIEGKTYYDSWNGVPLRLLEEISSSEEAVV